MPTSSKPNVTREQVHEVLWELAAKHTNGERNTLQVNSRLAQDLGADSLDVVELHMELQEQLGVNLPDDVAEDVNLTLGELEEAIWRHLHG